MVLDPSFGGNVGRIRLTLALVACAAMTWSCMGKASGSGCLFIQDGTLIEFAADETVGFDVVTPPGASLAIAVDAEDEELALIIALRFSSTTVERSFEPTCDADAAIDSYDFGATDSVTDDIALDYPFLEDGITDTAGVLDMDHSMNALLIINDDDGDRVFLAIDGSITLRRTGGGTPENRVRGELVFVELSGAHAAAGVLAGGETLRIEDIDFTWDTSVAPS
ncbi:MAG: hypothetical protein GY733_10340 [bacterium]|nr:hypothetical protein [bacterium]